MKRRSFLLNALGLAAAVGGGLWLKDNVLWRKPSLDFAPEAPWVPLERAARPLPVIKAKVGGQDVLALIDSGAQYSVVDRGLADALVAQNALGKTFDMPMVAYGVGGNAQLGRGVTLPVELAGHTIASLRAAILELGPLASSEGPGVALIIGRDVLRKVVLELDLDQQRLRLSDPDTWQAGAHFKAVPTRTQGDALGVEVSVEGAVIHAIFDTGASSLLSISEATANDAGLLDGRAEEAGASLVLGGVSQARWISVQTVTLGEEMWRDARVPVFGDSNLPNYPNALLGIGAFTGREIVLDLGRERLYVAGQLDLTIN